MPAPGATEPEGTTDSKQDAERSASAAPRQNPFDTAAATSAADSVSRQDFDTARLRMSTTIASPAPSQTLDAWLSELELEEYADALRGAGYSTLRFLRLAELEEITEDVSMKRPHARLFADAFAELVGHGTPRRPPAAPTDKITDAVLQSPKQDSEELVALIPSEEQDWGVRVEGGPPIGFATLAPATLLVDAREALLRNRAFDGDLPEDWVFLKNTAPVGKKAEGKWSVGDLGTEIVVRGKTQAPSPPPTPRFVQAPSQPPPPRQTRDEELLPASQARRPPPEGFSAHTVFVNHETGEHSSPTLRLLTMPPAVSSPEPPTGLGDASSQDGGSSLVFSSTAGDISGTSRTGGTKSPSEGLESAKALAKALGDSAPETDSESASPEEKKRAQWAKMREQFTRGSRATTEDGQVGVVLEDPAAEGTQANRVQLQMGDGSVTDPIRIDALTVAPVPLFRMEDCTLLVWGIPGGSEYDEAWLREVFGEFGEFVAGSRRKRDDIAFVSTRAIPTAAVLSALSLTDCLCLQGLVTFRNEYHVIDLLADADITAKSYNALRQAGAKQVTMRSFGGDLMNSEDARTWMDHADNDELRLAIGMPEQDRKGALNDAWMESVSMTKENVTDFQLFLAIDCGRGLPAMDMNSGDPFCRAWFVDPMADCEWHHQEPIEDEPEEVDAKQGCLPCMGGPEIPDVPLFDGQHLLGNTTVESKNYDNPNFLWSLTEERVVPGIGGRGWLVVQLLDQDKWDDSVVGQITINLDSVANDEEVGGWYTVGADDDTALGVIQIRLLLCSHPKLADSSKTFLLEDYDVLQITQTAISLRDGYCSDRETLRGMQADGSRLMWRADELMNRAFRTLDVDGGGSIDPDELAVIMALVGENLSALELGLMVVECKTWAGKSDQPALVEEVDLDDEDSGINRSEFKNMLTVYWTCRRYNTKDNPAVRGLATREKPKVAYSPNEVIVTRDGVPVDEDDAMTTTIEGEPGFFGNTNETEVAITNDLPPCPTWMTELAKAHDRLDGDQRVGSVFWWFLRSVFNGRILISYLKNPDFLSRHLISY